MQTTGAISHCRKQQHVGAKAGVGADTHRNGVSISGKGTILLWKDRGKPEGHDRKNRGEENTSSCAEPAQHSPEPDSHRVPSMVPIPTSQITPMV